MAYATQQDILDRYGEDALYTLADRDNDDELDTRAIDLALSDASEHIDAFLAARYTLPLEKVPAILGRLCVDIAFYWLGEDRGGASEERRKRFEDAERMLTRLSDGKIKLDTSSTGEGGEGEGEGTTGSGTASVQSNERLFSRTSLSGF